MAVLVEKDGVKGMRTGDRGWLDEDGFLYITGRFKEEYKLENGKYVHPASIEEDAKLLPSIANMFVYGEGKRYNVALAVPELDGVKELCASNGITFNGGLEDINNNKEVRDLLDKTIKDKLANIYGGYEIPRKIYYITEDFTIENEMLTQTMKLKRRNVVDRYKDILEKLYQD